MATDTVTAHYIPCASCSFKGMITPPAATDADPWRALNSWYSSNSPGTDKSAYHLQHRNNIVTILKYKLMTSYKILSKMCMQVYINSARTQPSFLNSESENPIGNPSALSKKPLKLEFFNVHLMPIIV